MDTQTADRTAAGSPRLTGPLGIALDSLELARAQFRDVKSTECLEFAARQIRWIEHELNELIRDMARP